MQLKSIHVLMGASLLTLASCGVELTESKNNFRSFRQNMMLQDGTYRAILSSENPTIVDSSGVAEVIVRGDEIKVNVSMNGTPASMDHAQHIHSGSRCPTSGDDTNGDGVISSAEAEKAYGGILIPLDDKLHDVQEMGQFPMADSQGNYEYSSSGSLEFLSRSLEDQLQGRDLNLDGKVVNIHGSMTDPLFPIACGILMKMDGGPTTGTTTGTPPLPIPLPQDEGNQDHNQQSSTTGSKY